jgi:hypothetical protein
MKRNAILLQEAYRRDGHVDFIKKTSEVCGVPRSTLKKWRQQYLKGRYTEVTDEDVEVFRATTWRIQKEALAAEAFGVARKILYQIDGILEADAEILPTDEVKDLALAFSKMLGSVRRFTPDEERPASSGKVERGLPSTLTSPSRA